MPTKLQDAWVRPGTTARLHILRAHRSPRAVIIRRKPSKRCHIVAWDTVSDDIVHGSWFQGRIYAERCDLSWDGHWMVYMALGARGNTWNGICHPPWLRTCAAVPNMGTWAGGGVFSGEHTLRSNDNWCWDRSLSEFSKSKEVPFVIEHTESGGEVFPILGHRLERDGWKREGAFGKDQVVSLKHCSYASLCVDDPGWSWRPTPRHPVLRMFYRGYLVHGYTFEFQLEGSTILDARVDWATWSAKGDLLVARQGLVHRYSLAGLASGSPDFSYDLESLAPPPKGSRNSPENDDGRSDISRE